MAKKWRHVAPFLCGRGAKWRQWRQLAPIVATNRHFIGAIGANWRQLAPIVGANWRFSWRRHFSISENVDVAPIGDNGANWRHFIGANKIAPRGAT